MTLPCLPLGLVVNTAARSVRRRYLAADPFWRTHLSGAAVRETRSLGELENVIAEFRAAGVRAVACLGGDGTLHHLVGALLRQYDEHSAPIVLSLAGGTMNGLPRALGTGGAPEPVLRAAIAALASGTPPVRVRHLLQITDTINGVSSYGFGFATGLVVRAFEHYYRSAEPGMFDAIRASLLPLKAALFGGPFYDKTGLDVEIDGAKWLADPHTLVASVFDNPLLWFEPFGAAIGDGEAFHIAMLSMRPAEITPRLWSIFRGRCHHPGLRIGQGQEVNLHGDIGYLIDGELSTIRDRLDVRLSIGPRLRFLDPMRALQSRDSPQSSHLVSQSSCRLP